MPAPEYIVGVDLGQANDYTAIAVLERHHAEGPTGRPEATYQVRHLDRLPLGTPYPKQVETLAVIMQHVNAPPARAPLAPHQALPQARLVVDQTGVGRPVVDLLRQTGHKHLTAVTIHGGDTMTREGRDYRVPKRELVSVLQVLLQTRRLAVASALPHAETLTREMLAFKVTISATGHDTYGNDWRENPHDDLVLAVALAAWAGETLPRRHRVTPQGSSSTYRLA